MKSKVNKLKEDLRPVRPMMAKLQKGDVFHGLAQAGKGLLVKIKSDARRAGRCGQFLLLIGRKAKTVGMKTRL